MIASSGPLPMELRQSSAKSMKAMTWIHRFTTGWSSGRISSIMMMAWAE
jgi:hypothetical protein